MIAGIGYIVNSAPEVVNLWFLVQIIEIGCYISIEVVRILVYGEYRFIHKLLAYFVICAINNSLFLFEYHNSDKKCLVKFI